MLPAPVAFTHGHFTIELDPAVFGPISAVSVFSASGDQQGFARLQGSRAEVEFGAESGGIGRLPNLPVAEITAPVLSSAIAGTTGSVTVRTVGLWYDVSGTAYSLAFQTPGVTVGAGLSIEGVVPDGRQLSAGTVVTIKGQGFTRTTKLQLDGVAWSNLQFVNPSLLTITLSGPTDLVGKLFLLSDEGGRATRYWSGFRPNSVRDETTFGYWPIFPAVTYMRLNTGSTSGYWWFANASASPVDVAFNPVLTVCTPCARQGLVVPPSKRITVPPDGVYIANYSTSGPNSWPISGITVTASAPIRILQGGNFTAADGSLRDLSTTALSPNGGYSLDLRPSCTDLAVNYRIGGPPPPPISCDLTYLIPVMLGTTPVTVSAFTAGTDDGNSWLHVSSVADSKSKFTVSIDPSKLSPGTHLGTLTAALAGASVGYLQANLKLDVHDVPLIATKFGGWVFGVNSPAPVSFDVTSDGPPVPVVATPSDDWVKVAATSATTPTTITITIAPWTLPGLTAFVTIRGPGNSLVVPIETSGSNLAFTTRAGSTTPIESTLSEPQPFDFKVTTDSGGSWLSAAEDGLGAVRLTIRADPSGLAPATYHGTINCTPKAAAGTPYVVAVTLSIWSDPTPPLSSSLPRLSVSRLSAQYLSVNSGSVALPFTVAYDTSSPTTLSGPRVGITPATLNIGANSMYPGTYERSLTITAATGSPNSAYVPVTINAPPAPVVDPFKPRISAIVNAGSMLPGPLAPGEVVSVFGLLQTIGNAVVHTGEDGKVNRALFGNRLLFNGFAAPLTYLSASQINTVVPYEVAGSSTVTVEIDAGGVRSEAWSIPVATSAPGLFTQDGTGQGSGSILNQDSTLNGPTNPAAPGSVVQIFLTGEGATDPPAITGEMTGLNTKAAMQAVGVQIGGLDAKVVSASSAPEAIAGLFQVNAVVPTAIPAGLVPVVVTIGDASSQKTATVSVR